MSTALDFDPDGHEAESGIRQVIHNTITRHPRSQQTRIGPSEAGHPCDRFILHRLHGDRPDERGDRWRPTVGTALHSWMEHAFTAAADAESIPRWQTEQRVTCFYLPDGTPITGSVDLYDHATGTVTDFKFVSQTRIKEARANGPSEQYRRQVHQYGGGWMLAGHTVERVAIYYIPRDGLLTDSYYWCEPFNPDLWQDTANRVQTLWRDLQRLGIEQALAEHDYCSDRWCKFCTSEKPQPTLGETIANHIK